MPDFLPDFDPNFLPVLAVIAGVLAVEAVMAVAAVAGGVVAGPFARLGDVMTFHDFYLDQLDRDERHPVRTPNGYWRWTHKHHSRPECMSDLPHDAFNRLPKEACDRPAYLFTTRAKARDAAARAYFVLLCGAWDATTPAPEAAEYPEG